MIAASVQQNQIAGARFRLPLEAVLFYIGKKILHENGYHTSVCDQQRISSLMDQFSQPGQYPGFLSDAAFTART